MNLNFDMLASPNYRRGIYNGSSGAENIRHGSTQIQKIFEKNYQDVGLSYDLVEFNGRSDYGPFIEVGVSNLKKKIIQRYLQVVLKQVLKE